jgi:hypothetical protein
VFSANWSLPGIVHIGLHDVKLGGMGNFIGVFPPDGTPKINGINTSNEGDSWDSTP